MIAYSGESGQAGSAGKHRGHARAEANGVEAELRRARGAAAVAVEPALDVDVIRSRRDRADAAARVDQLAVEEDLVEAGASRRGPEVDDDVMPLALGGPSQEAIAVHRVAVRPEAAAAAVVVALVVPELEGEVGAAAVVSLQLHDQVVASGPAVDHRLDVEGEGVEVLGSLAEEDGVVGAAAAVAAEDQLGAVLTAAEGEAARADAAADDAAGHGRDHVADAGGVPVEEAVLEAGIDHSAGAAADRRRRPPAEGA